MVRVLGKSLGICQLEKHHSLQSKEFDGNNERALIVSKVDVSSRSRENFSSQ